jgi:hypothetical protein
MLVGGQGVAQAEESALLEVDFDFHPGHGTSGFASELPVAQPFKVKIKAPPNARDFPSGDVMFDDDKVPKFAMIPEGKADDDPVVLVAIVKRLSVGRKYCFAVEVSQKLGEAAGKKMSTAMSEAIRLTVDDMYKTNAPSHQARARLAQRFLLELQQIAPPLANAQYRYGPDGKSSAIGLLLWEQLGKREHPFLKLVTGTTTDVVKAMRLPDDERWPKVEEVMVAFETDPRWTSFCDNFFVVDVSRTARSHTLHPSATEARPFYVALDVGVGVGLFPGRTSALREPDFFQYVGVNFYLSAVDKEEPLTGLASDFKKRVSLTAGLTLGGLKSADERGVKGLLGGSRLVFGAGYRLSSYLRVSGGAVVYRYENPHPLSNQKGLGASPYLSFSLDFDTFTWLKEQAKKI